MKTKLKFVVFVAASAFIGTNLQAQSRLNLSDPSEFTVFNRYSEMKGQPFLFKDWALGTVKTADKGEKKDVQIKYDEVEDRLLTKGEGEQMMQFASPIVEFVIADAEKGGVRTFKSGFSATKFSTDKTLFQVLVDGKVKLLRKNNKTISEGKEYGSAAIIKTVIDGIKYYIVGANNEPVVVKLDQKAILALLPDKQTELTEYAKSNKLNLKKEEDAAKLIAYYNTL